MAVELNMLRAFPGDPFSLSPRRIQGLWLTAKTIEREREKRAAVVFQAAQSDEKSFKEWMKT